MIPATPPALISQSIKESKTDWDKAIETLDKKIQGNRGVGLILSIERSSDTEITTKHVERGGSSSAWVLTIRPWNKATGKGGKELRFDRPGGSGMMGAFSPFENRQIVGADSSHIKVQFSTQQYGGQQGLVELPPVGGRAKIILLYQPEFK
jgi:hypothetical protein